MIFFLRGYPSCLDAQAKMIKTLCSYLFPENMDNFKQSGSIFISIFREENSFSSFWKYIVLILIKIYGFSEFNVQFSESKNTKIRVSIVTALRKLIRIKFVTKISSRSRLLHETLTIISKNVFWVFWATL